MFYFLLCIFFFPLVRSVGSWLIKMSTFFHLKIGFCFGFCVCWRERMHVCLLPNFITYTRSKLEQQFWQLSYGTIQPILVQTLALYFLFEFDSRESSAQEFFLLGIPFWVIVKRFNSPESDFSGNHCKVAIPLDLAKIPSNQYILF